MKFILAITSLFLLPLAAHAEKAIAHPGSVAGSALSTLILASGGAGCTLTETTSVSISFNSIEKDMAVATNLIEKKTAEIKALASQAGIEKADISSVNYNMNPYNTGYPSEDMTWQVSGSLSMNINPSTKAKDFVLLLSKNKYQPSLSVNAYRSGNCQ